MELIERLRVTGETRMAAEPWDDPQHFMNVYARLSREDGALMVQAADAIEALQQELREARWAAFVAGYNAGFNASAEGWNGEYPMGHERDPYWLTRREEAVAAFLAKSQ